MNGIFLIAAAFLASGVESVEMLSILVGVGQTRGWRSTWIGAAAGFAVLTLVVVGMGAALQRIPIQPLRLAVGALLLVFGLQWLKKAVVRIAKSPSGIFHKHVDADDDAGEQPPARGGQIDWYAFVVVFKGVLLEGLEIAFVVVTFGAESHQIGLAAIGAVAAFVATAGIAFWIRPWLANIPREWLRFGVGVLLATFGTFWSAEGAGVHWPGDDLAILGLLAVMTGAAFGLVWMLRQWRAVAPQTT